MLTANRTPKSEGIPYETSLVNLKLLKLSLGQREQTTVDYGYFLGQRETLDHVSSTYSDAVYILQCKPFVEADGLVNYLKQMLLQHL